MHQLWTLDRIRRFEDDYNVECVLNKHTHYYSEYDKSDPDKWVVQGDIYLEDVEISSFDMFLPPITRLNGDLTVFHTDIIDFIGCPDNIFGNLYLDYNKFKTLTGFPAIHMPHNTSGRRVASMKHNELQDIHGLPLNSQLKLDCRSNPDLRICKSDLENYRTIIVYDPEQLVPEDPSEFIKRGILPI